ncbi:hypothetical protein ACFX1W_040910 [Malus domestica]
MVRFYLIIRGLWVCSSSICLRLLGLYRVMKLQPLAPLLPGVPPSSVASNSQPPAPLISGALPSGDAAPDRP